MTIPDTLNEVPLFRGLDPAALRVLADRAAVVRFAPDETLWRAGDEPSGLFTILEGQVRVVRSRNGKRHVIHIEEADGTLGEIPFFEGGCYPATAIAARRTTCLALDADAIRAAIGEDPDLALRLLARLSGRVRHLVERLDRIATLNVAGRLAGYLLRRRSEVDSSVLTLGRTQREVAEELGTVREVVVRQLRELQDAGLIRRVERGRLELVDIRGLWELAGRTGAEPS